MVRPINLIWLAHVDKHWPTAKIRCRLRSHLRSERKQLMDASSEPSGWKENPIFCKQSKPYETSTWFYLGQGAHISCFGDSRKFTSVSCHVSILSNFTNWVLIHCSSTFSTAFKTETAALFQAWTQLFFSSLEEEGVTGSWLRNFSKQGLIPSSLATVSEWSNHVPPVTLLAAVTTVLTQVLKVEAVLLKYKLAHQAQYQVCWLDQATKTA